MCGRSRPEVRVSGEEQEYQNGLPGVHFNWQERNNEWNVYGETWLQWIGTQHSNEPRREVLIRFHLYRKIRASVQWEICTIRWAISEVCESGYSGLACELRRRLSCEKWYFVHTKRLYAMMTTSSWHNTYRNLHRSSIWSPVCALQSSFCSRISRYRCDAWQIGRSVDISTLGWQGLLRTNRREHQIKYKKFEKCSTTLNFLISTKRTQLKKIVWTNCQEGNCPQGFHVQISPQCWLQQMTQHSKMEGSLNLHTKHKYKFSWGPSPSFSVFVLS